MPNQKPDQVKKSLIVLDFDQTLFYNRFNNFTLNISLENIIDSRTFFSEFTYQTGKIISKKAQFMLITGRRESQKNLILPYLKVKGYQIDQAFFN